MEVYLLVGIGIMAFLYSSVGHGGASGYLAVMAIMGITPSLMKSSALILNLFVSFISFANYYKKEDFKSKYLIYLLIASIPMAYMGAKYKISDNLYKYLLVGVIFFGIYRLLFLNPVQTKPLLEPKNGYFLIIGAIIGLLSGMLGIGGGIILSPVLLLLGWVNLKEAAILSAIFIFANSLSGLFGLLSTGYELEPKIYSWIAVAIVGGLVGGYFGSKKYNLNTLKMVLAAVLVISCVKLLF